MTPYRLIFDEAVRGYREWWFPACLFAAGLWLVFLRAALRRFDKATADKILPPWILPFALLLGVGGAGVMLQRTYQPHARLRDALKSGQYRTIEGVVSSVRPGDPGGFAITTADGQSHDYRYSEHHWTPGYRGTYPPLRLGQWARVAEVDGHVARLEVANDSPR